MFKFFSLIVAIFLIQQVKAQDVSVMDTVIQLDDVVVTGYVSDQPLLQTPTSVGIITDKTLRNQVGESVLPAMNFIPGVRMEERSPGSYRLSVRGSLLRSPWGVRNVKVYMDEFPLTDAGGNTYLNLIDPRSIYRMEVLKGPHGSLFGANSGGVVLIDPIRQLQDSSLLRFGISSGSYGMIQQNLAVQKRSENSHFNLSQAFQKSDGYRENSAMRRHYIQMSELWNYNATNELKVFGFYANLNYRTPGGLNEEQYLEDPRQARQPAGPNPGAVEQKAGIDNETIFGGVSHEANLTGNLRHVASFFGSKTNFANPFITNYEERDEKNYGVRSYLELVGQSDKMKWKWNAGLEFQRSNHQITNYDNIGNATKGDLQASDEIITNQHFYFTRVSANLLDRLTAEAAFSVNYYKYMFTDLTDNGEPGKRTFSPEWMPRVGVSYLVTDRISWRASVSRGYSPPTTAEIRPSNIVINTDLEAETGWNYETGWRFTNRNNRFQVDASVFYYQMDEAIVRRLDEGGNEYFKNAGGTRQLGLESLITTWIINARNTGFIRGLKLSNSYTYNNFEFSNYIQGTEDYTGNRLTGVPHYVVVTNLEVNLPKAVSFYAQHNYTDRIPLNDSNTAYADGYNLIQAKLSWRKTVNGKHELEVFARVDNLLNEKYSLGNDINAYGNRFYNAAPSRSFSAGLNFTL